MNCKHNLLERVLDVGYLLSKADKPNDCYRCNDCGELFKVPEILDITITRGTNAG